VPTPQSLSGPGYVLLAALANAKLGKIYTNIIYAISIQSFKTMQYIFAAYIY
jgi:hypothetical protein